MTRQEYIQVSKSLGLIPEIRGFSVVLASYTGHAYFGWERIYPEGYEQYFSQMKSEFNSAIINFKSLKIEQKLSNIQKDF